MPITITHTRADGTLVEGTRKGDGAGKILHRCQFRPSRHLPGDAYWYLPHSRDRRAKQWEIDQAVKALQAVGFVVAVEIDDVTPGRSFTDAEKDRYDRAEDRAARFGGHADNAAQRSNAADHQYRQWADNWPLGQPLISDRRRVSHKRGMGAHDRAMREWHKAAHWNDRADSAARYRAGRENVATTLRRIKKLEADRRRLERDLGDDYERVPDSDVAGPPSPQSTRVPADNEARARIEADIAAIDDELNYWRNHIAQAEANGVKIWGSEDFRAGDYAKVSGYWVRVLRVNKKTLTLPAIISWPGRRIIEDSDLSWTDRIPYDEVTGHATPDEIANMSGARTAQWPKATDVTRGEAR